MLAWWCSIRHAVWCILLLVHMHYTSGSLCASQGFVCNMWSFYIPSCNKIVSFCSFCLQTLLQCHYCIIMLVIIYLIHNPSNSRNSLSAVSKKKIRRTLPLVVNNLLFILLCLNVNSLRIRSGQVRSDEMRWRWDNI